MGVPLGRFNDFVTADRHEIEGYRSIQALLSEYCSKPQTKPVSIAVCGPPGSGKSFGITQVAKSLKLKRDPKTFNLSHFVNPDQLTQALHVVRDIGLSGDVPLIFWDEFDAALGESELGWLRYFLAPMQDGEFQERHVTHPIGRAIFVFAGGTCHTLQKSDRGADDPAFRMAKGPDFVSRLQGYVNVMGPDPGVQGGWDAPNSVRDPPRHRVTRPA